MLNTDRTQAIIFPFSPLFIHKECAEMAKILITEVVHEVAAELLRAAGHEVILD